MAAWEATTLARRRRPSATMPTAVSSQEVSTPRMSTSHCHSERREESSAGLPTLRIFVHPWEGLICSAGLKEACGGHPPPPRQGFIPPPPLFALFGRGGGGRRP